MCDTIPHLTLGCAKRNESNTNLRLSGRRQGDIGGLNVGCNRYGFRYKSAKLSPIRYYQW